MPQRLQRRVRAEAQLASAKLSSPVPQTLAYPKLDQPCPGARAADRCQPGRAGRAAVPAQPGPVGLRGGDRARLRRARGAAALDNPALGRHEPRRDRAGAGPRRRPPPCARLGRATSGAPVGGRSSAPQAAASGAAARGRPASASVMAKAPRLSACALLRERGLVAWRTADWCGRPWQDGALRALAPIVTLTCLNLSGCTEVTDAGARPLRRPLRRPRLAHVRCV